MGKSTISMVIFHCYVSSPEGTSGDGAYRIMTKTNLGHPGPVHEVQEWIVRLGACHGLAAFGTKALVTAGVFDPSFGYGSIPIDTMF